jgi:PTH1 family peptidyl-tRNA hydrolase
MRLAQPAVLRPRLFVGRFFAPLVLQGVLIPACLRRSLCQLCPYSPEPNFPACARNSMAIKLIVGLGNIGAEYEHTRHNAGFWFVDAYAHDMGASLKNEKGFFGAVGKAGGVILLEPGTYMNRSGQAVLAVATFYKILPDEILVVHDELDLPPGAAKIKKGGGHAGHNGLKDIAARLSTPDFWRLRLGIGHPRELGMAQEVADFVLHKPSREHQTLIDEAIERSLKVMPDAVGGRMEIAVKNLHSAK